MNEPLKICSIAEGQTGADAQRGPSPALDPQLVSALTRSVPEAKRAAPADIIIALNSAEIFTAVYETLHAHLRQQPDRALLLVRGEVHVIVKGDALPQEAELLAKLAPEGLPTPSDAEERGEMPSYAKNNEATLPKPSDFEKPRPWGEKSVPIDLAII